MKLSFVYCMCGNSKNVRSKTNFQPTRMHSSRMRTIRNFSRLLEGGACSLGGACFQGVPAPGGGGIPACTEAHHTVDRQTGVKT